MVFNFHDLSQFRTFVCFHKNDKSATVIRIFFFSSISPNLCPCIRAFLDVFKHAPSEHCLLLQILSSTYSLHWFIPLRNFHYHLFFSDCLICSLCLKIVPEVAKAHLKIAAQWPSLPCIHICPPGGGWAGRSGSACVRCMAQYPWSQPAAGSWCGLSSPWSHQGSPLIENSMTEAVTRTMSWSINRFGHQSVERKEKDDFHGTTYFHLLIATFTFLSLP